VNAVVGVVILVLAITIFGVAADHRELERDYGRHVGDSTAQWVVGCILLWIIVFPLYLLHRSRHKRLSAAWDVDEGDEVPQGTGAFCGACGTQQAAAEDRFCRECGASLDV
jgi:hypothetical protein